VHVACAMLVLRLGVKLAFLDNDSTCNKTAPELCQTSPMFMSLSVAAWGTITFGYLMPFCCAFILITRKNDTTTASRATANATSETCAQDNNLHNNLTSASVEKNTATNGTMDRAVLAASAAATTAVNTRQFPFPSLAACISNNELLHNLITSTSVPTKDYKNHKIKRF